MTDAERERQPDTTTHDSIPTETGKNDGDGTSGDCISRQAVTKFLNDWLSCLFENCHKQSASDLKMIIKDFKNLPSAQPEPEAVFEWKREFKEYIESLDITRDEWKGIIEYINDVPTVQPERKTGRWIPCLQSASWLYVYKCSECGGYLQISDVDGKGYKANYCSYCGAKMEGEQEWKDEKSSSE